MIATPRWASGASNSHMPPANVNNVSSAIVVWYKGLSSMSLSQANGITSHRHLLATSPPTAKVV
jgi:hypothetical protein